MKYDRKLGDKINRGFAFTVFILFSIMIIRFVISVTREDVAKFKTYPETMDEFLETSHGSGISIELIDSAINAAYVDDFFNSNDDYERDID